VEGMVKKIIDPDSCTIFGICEQIILRILPIWRIKIFNAFKKKKVHRVSHQLLLPTM